MFRCASPEIVRDNMGHADIRRDPESLQQEMMGSASGRVCRKMYAAAYLRQTKQEWSSGPGFRSLVSFRSLTL